MTVQELQPRDQYSFLRDLARVTTYKCQGARNSSKIETVAPSSLVRPARHAYRAAKRSLAIGNSNCVRCKRFAPAAVLVLKFRDGTKPDVYDQYQYLSRLSYSTESVSQQTKTTITFATQECPYTLCRPSPIPGRQARNGSFE